MSKKIVASFVSFTTAVWLSGAAAIIPVAHADEVADLQAQIQMLLEQISQLQKKIAEYEGKEALPAVKFERDLTLGSTGADVKALQEFLNRDEATRVAESGPGSPGNETEYFGALTKAAVKKFQELHADEILAPVGLSHGTGYFGPSTRSYINSLIEKEAAKEEEEEEVEEEEEEVVGNVLEVEAVELADGAVPKKATAVPMLKVKLTAGDEDVTIDKMVFERKGIGSPGDFDEGYLYEGDVRLTDGRSVRSDNTLTHRNLDLEIKAGESREITLALDIADDADVGDINYFVLKEIDCDADEVAGLPVEGARMTQAASEVGKITVSEKAIDNLVNIGDEDVTLAKLKVDIDGEDAELKQITFTQEGSASLDELENIECEGAEIEISGDKLVVKFEDEIIEDGDSKTYEIKADIGIGVDPDDDAIKLSIDEVYDVVAIGQDYGYGLDVVNNFDATAIEVEGGEMNLAYVGPKTQDISAGDDIKVFEFDVANADELKVKETKVKIKDLIELDSALLNGDGDGDLEEDEVSPYLDNFRLIDVDENKVLASTDDFEIDNAAAGDIEITFSEDYILDPGETRLAVLIDIDDGIYDFAGAIDFFAELQKFGANKVKDLDTGDYLVPADDIVPNDEIAGKEQTIEEIGLTVAKAVRPESQTYVVGEDDAELAGFVLSAGPAEGVKINEIKLKAQADDTDDGAIGANAVKPSLTVSSVYLVDSTGAKIASSENLSNDDIAEVTFSDIDLTLAASESETIKVIGDIRSDATAKEIRFELDDIDYETLDTGIEKTEDANEVGNIMDIGEGQLTVKVDADTPDEDIAIAGANKVAFAIYEFEAENEDITIDKITVKCSGADELDNLEKVYLESSKGSASETSFADVDITFRNLNWTVEAGEKLDVKVYADINDLSDDALQSGEDFSLAIGDNTQLFDFRATGEASGEVYDEAAVYTDSGNPDLRVNHMVVYEGKPVVEFKSVSTDLARGNNPNYILYKFEVKADSSGDVIFLRGVKFEIDLHDDDGGGELDLTGKDTELIDSDGNILATDDDYTDGIVFNIAAADQPELGTVGDVFSVRADIVGVEENDAISINMVDPDDDANALTWDDDTAIGNAELIDIPEDVVHHEE